MAATCSAVSTASRPDGAFGQREPGGPVEQPLVLEPGTERLQLAHPGGNALLDRSVVPRRGASSGWARSQPW
jgi:hypothetical protein